MTSSVGHADPARPRPAERPVLSGRIPPLAESCSPRQETGLHPAGLPPGRATVLAAPGQAAAGRLGGLGGTGKTQLAAGLARAYLGQRAARLVLWVTAASRDAVVASYAQAGSDAGLPGPGGSPEQAAARFLDWLARTGEPWLVVLDDVRDAVALEGLWPHGAAGRVLVTTGAPDAAAPPGAQVTTVGAFSPREALWYLSERLRTDPDQRIGAPDLATELGFLPIALGQAAAVMTATGLGCREYRALLAERKAQLAAGPADAYASAAAAAWALSADLAGQQPPAGLARRALTLISVLGPHGIPGAVLTSQAACGYLAGSPDVYPADEAQDRETVRSLARAGLVTIDHGSAARTVLAHELVQAITRQGLPAAERDQAARAAADALAETWSEPGLPADVEQALRDCTARLHEAAGAALWTPRCHPVLVQAGQSLIVQQDVLARLESTEGPGHPATLAARASLARAYRDAGRPGDAIDLTAQTAAECERVLGAGHPDTLAARGDLADSYLAAGRAKDAIDVRKRVLADCERLHGPGHPGTIAARAGLALACRSAGKVKDAVRHYERALADRERVQGPGHQDTIVTRRELAFSYHLAGKLAKSVAQYERALADCRQALGPDHALTGATREDLDVVAAHAVAKLGIDLRTPDVSR